MNNFVNTFTSQIFSKFNHAHEIDTTVIHPFYKRSFIHVSNAILIFNLLGYGKIPYRLCNNIYIYKFNILRYISSLANLEKIQN